MHPLRLFMDQDAVDLVLQHVAVVDAHHAPPITLTTAEDEKGHLPPRSQRTKTDDIFFRQVKISKTAMVVDYKPKQIKLQNVKDGNIAELVNLFQFDGARIEFEALQLHAVSSFVVIFLNSFV